MRTVGVIRLSELTDETTSPARQREIITKAADLRGSEVVGWAVDLDVSASKLAPTERPELRHWLDREDEFDELLFWRTDRFVRKVSDLHDMIRWAELRGKGLASATEPFDLQTPLGRAMATLIAVFAEMESATTSERVTGAHEYLRQHARWGGGTWPYGRRAASNPDGAGFVLITDPESSVIALEAIERATGGQSRTSICADLNRRGILSPLDYQRMTSGKGLRCKCGHSCHELTACSRCGCMDYREKRTPWRQAGLDLILRSESLLGHQVHGGVVVTGDDGLPIMCCEPLVTETQWAQLQDAIRTGKSQYTQTKSLLLHVAYCAICGYPMHVYTKHDKGKRYFYYRCGSVAERVTQMVPPCRSFTIPRIALEEMVSAKFIAQVGQTEIKKRVYREGNDPGEIISLVRRSLNTVRKEYDNGLYEYQGGSEDYENRMQALTKRLKNLSSQTVLSAGYTYEPTGILNIDRWNDLEGDSQGRRQLMLQSGFRVYVARTRQSPDILMATKVDPELSERAAAAAGGRPVRVPETDTDALARVLGPLQKQG